MSGYPAFGVLLARLSGHRALDVRSLSGLAKIPEPELQAVFKGASPSLPLLTKLAPALGLHVADLLVIAGLPVPEELAPLDPRAGSLVPKVAGRSVRLPPGSREQLLDYARSLPQHDRTQPVPMPKSYEQYPPGFGTVLMHMLGNRNLNWWQSAQRFRAKTPTSVLSLGCGEGCPKYSTRMKRGWGSPGKYTIYTLRLVRRLRMALQAGSGPSIQSLWRGESHWHPRMTPTGMRSSARSRGQFLFIVATGGSASGQ